MIEPGVMAESLANMTLVDQADETDYFSRLPDEMILKIFKYLPHQFLGTCAAVCHRWRCLANDEDLWADCRLDAGMISLTGLTHLLQRGIRILSGKYIYVQPDPTSWDGVFPDNYKIKLRDLELFECKISSKSLALILNHAEQLESLNVKWGDVDEDCFDAIGKLKNLKTLRLGSSVTSMDAAAVETILKECPRLELLDLSYCGLNQGALDLLVARLPSSLLHLRLITANADSSSFSDYHVQEIARTCPNLVELDIRGHYNVSDVGYAVLDKMKHLEILRDNRDDVHRYSFVSLQGFIAGYRVPVLQI